MQKVINVLAVASAAVSVAVVGSGLYVYVNKDAIIESVTEKALDSIGIGGIGGKYIKPTGLSNVYNFYQEFKKRNLDIKIIGCGGIENGVDAFEYILCGADALQIGTQFYKENTPCFKRICDELSDIMSKKQYSTISEFKGKLMIKD